MRDEERKQEERGGALVKEDEKRETKVRPLSVSLILKALCKMKSVTSLSPVKFKGEKERKIR